MLQANKTIQCLDISDNDIRDYGIKAVTFSIQANTTLVELKFFDCVFSHESHLGCVVTSK